ncbi:helix-turn-helix domain-containing protein [Conexibacter arvalis]|uniref:helix-turn-helix transcriptional regulator n=1 Tax=Conexibacter arvalis TaxID=912552 RepID=UPI00161CA8B7
MSVGSAIRRHRTERGWSKARLARLTGFSRTSILYWEREEHEPRRVAVERLEAVFGLEEGSLNE